IESASPNLDALRQMKGENIKREMRPLPNAYGGTEQCQPCPRHFAQPFHPGEWNGVPAEIVREGAEEIAGDDAAQKIDDGQHDQGGDGHPWDRGDEPQHGMRPPYGISRSDARRAAGPSQIFAPRLRQLLKPAISSHSAPNWLL